MEIALSIYGAVAFLIFTVIMWAFLTDKKPHIKWNWNLVSAYIVFWPIVLVLKAFTGLLDEIFGE